jgi:hypothetical protein
MSQRETRKITYYLNPEFPADTKLRDQATLTVQDWNKAMKETVAAVKFSGTGKCGAGSSARTSCRRR